MSIRGALPSTAKPLVPFRPRERFTVTPQGLVNDMAMMSIRGLVDTDRAGSVLERLKTQPDNMALRCPESTCRDMPNNQCRESFCAVNMDMDADAIQVVELDPHDVWEQELAELGLGRATTVADMLTVYVERGDPDGATRLFDRFEEHAGDYPANHRRCHAVLFPFQTIFADRVLLPRESGLAYWSVGSGKTAGAAALMLQAGRALTQGEDHPRKHERLGPQELPIHFVSVLDDFGRKSANAARLFTHRVRDYYAILTQADRGHDGLPTCAVYDGAVAVGPALQRWAAGLDRRLGDPAHVLDDPDAAEDDLLTHIERLSAILGADGRRYAESLVLLNDVQRLTDDVYLLFKTVNMLCMYGGEELSPGYPPVIGAFTATPAGGGFRTFLMTLDLLDNATSQARDPGSRQAHALMPPGDLTPELIDSDANTAANGRVLNEATVLTNETTRDMVEWMGLAPYQRGRRGEQVVVPVRELTCEQSAGVPVARFADLLGFNETYRPVIPTDAPPERRNGTVMDVRQDGQGAVVLVVQLADEPEDTDTVLVPAMLAELSGAALGNDGVVTTAYTEVAGRCDSTILTPDAAADPPGLAVVDRNLTLTHASNDAQGAAEKPFETILMEHFNLLGKMSYVNLHSTGLYPRKQFNLDVTRSSALPESAHLTDLIDPMFVVRNPGAAVYGGPDAERAWDLVRRSDDRNNQLEYVSLKFSNLSAGKPVYYTTLFYAALFQMVFGETADYFSAGDVPNLMPDELIQMFVQLDLISHNDMTTHHPKLERWLDVLGDAANAFGDRAGFLRALGAGITPPKLAATFERVVQGAAADERVFAALRMAGGPILMYASYRSFPGLMALCALQQTKIDNEQEGQPRMEPLIDPMAWLNQDGTPLLLRGRSAAGQQGVKLMLISDKAASEDFDDFAVDGSGRPRQLVFFTPPKSKERMLQIEGRIHRNLCDAADQHQALRTSTYWVMCGNWPGAEGLEDVRDQINARDVRRLGRPADGRASETRTNAWAAVTAEADRVQAAGTSRASTFDELNFVECSATHSDCRIYLDLQTDVAGYEVFFESLAQQLSMNRSVGDDLVSGQTIEWTEFRRSHDTPTMLQLCDEYLNHVGRAAPAAEAAEAPEPRGRRRGGSRRGRRGGDGERAPPENYGPADRPPVWHEAMDEDQPGGDFGPPGGEDGAEEYEPELAEDYQEGLDAVPDYRSDSDAKAAAAEVEAAKQRQAEDQARAKAAARGAQEARRAEQEGAAAERAGAEEARLYYEAEEESRRAAEAAAAAQVRRARAAAQAQRQAQSRRVREQAQARRVREQAQARAQEQRHPESSVELNEQFNPPDGWPDDEIDNFLQQAGRQIGAPARPSPPSSPSPAPPSPPSPAQTRNAHRKRKDYQRDNAQTLARDKLVAQRRHASQPRTPATASRFCAASATRGPRSCAATDLGSAPAVVFDAKQNAAAAQRHHRENRQNSTGRQFKQREPGSRKRKPGQATPQVTLRRPATRPGPPQPKQQPLLEQMAVDGAQGEAELPRRFGHQPRNLLGEYSST
jgi:hypothetical protein